MLQCTEFVGVGFFPFSVDLKVEMVRENCMERVNNRDWEKLKTSPLETHNSQMIIQ